MDKITFILMLVLLIGPLFAQGHMTTDRVPKLKDWEGNKIGVTDENWCPKPWTPLVVKDNSISCTDRTYTIGSDGLFSSITSLGEELLYNPMSFVIDIEKQVLSMSNAEIPERFSSEGVKIVSKKTGCVHWTCNNKGERLDYKVTGKIEFDGYSELTVEFIPKSSVTVKSLQYLIDYRNECATLFHYFPKVPVWYGGVNVTKLNAGSVPNEWRSEHIPFVWIGNEDKGLQWLTETDENWFISDETKAINIFSNKDKYKDTVLQLNIIDIPTKFDKPWSYTFSFHASPVRPLSNDRYKIRYAHAGGLLDVIKGCCNDQYDFWGLKGYTDYGANTIDSFAWTELWGYPMPAWEDNAIMLRASRDMTKSRNMKFFVSNLFLLSDKAPEFKNYFDEIKVVDKNAYTCPGWWDDTLYAVCQNSKWVDFQLKGYKDCLTEYNLDGIYSDSTTTIGYCANQKHGCGYIDREGNLKPTVRYRAVREYMKRVYKLFEDMKKPMIFVAHTSASIYLPTSSFVTFNLDTEHMVPIKRPFRIPLDAFRAEFMGRNFGVPGLVMSYENGSIKDQPDAPFENGVSREEMFAIAIVHDTEYTWDHYISSYMWKAQDDFGMDDVTFLPYWKNNGWTYPEGVYVSAYTKPNSNKMLLCVSNLSENSIEGNIDLGRKITSFKQYYHGENTTLENGQLHDIFEPFLGKIYIVEF
ncbi:MAG: hypothetical protein IJS60_02695 [Abditibacteriota bacterium]|nr:hypothetical protein [Abditibacteriota bacterium]